MTQLHEPFNAFNPGLTYFIFFSNLIYVYILIRSKRAPAKYEKIPKTNVAALPTKSSAKELHHSWCSLIMAPGQRFSPQSIYLRLISSAELKLLCGSVRLRSVQISFRVNIMFCWPLKVCAVYFQTSSYKLFERVFERFHLWNRIGEGEFN